VWDPGSCQVDKGALFGETFVCVCCQGVIIIWLVGAHLLTVGALLEVCPQTFATSVPWFGGGTTAGVRTCICLWECDNKVQILLEQEFELFALCVHFQKQSGQRINNRC
jgi:hypothetical protein